MMTEEDKTEKQPSQEPAGLRQQRIDVLEKSKAVSKQLEHKLADSEVRYRRLFEAAQDGILILNAADGKITDANPFLLDLLGYSKEDILGKNLWDIGIFKDIKKSKKAFKKLQESGYVRYDDLPLETRAGLLMNVEVVSNVYPVNGNMVIQCNIRDITEGKRAKEALEASIKQYQDLYEEAPNAYFSVGTDGCIKMANRRATELLGYSMDELIGKPVIDLYADTPKGKARASEIFQQFTSARETKVEELQMLTAGGRELWITLSVSRFWMRADE
ncbi:MAG: PAS domain-containing protein [Dehalococcoidales bacterium]|jgi:PAS domain S-box-containing protein